MAKPLNGLFGNTSELQLMHSLLPLKGVEFNITDLQSVTSLTRPVLTRVVKKFASWDMLKIAYKHGNANFYELNTNSPVVILFQRLNSKIIEYMLETDVLMDLREHRQQRRKTEARTPDTMRPTNVAESSGLNWTFIKQQGAMHITTDLAQPFETPRCTAESALEGEHNVYTAS